VDAIIFWFVHDAQKAAKTASVDATGPLPLSNPFTQPKTASKSRRLRLLLNHLDTPPRLGAVAKGPPVDALSASCPKAV
jgi:hypothetical protein